MSEKVEEYGGCDEEYDMLDDLLYRTFITEDLNRLNEGLNPEQRLLVKKILSRAEKVASGRERLAFKKGLAQGRQQNMER